MHEDFNSLDINKDGWIDAGEIRKTVPGMSESDITEFFDLYDGDRDGVFSFEEFYNMI